MNKYVKQDINFMEYPLWFQDKVLCDKLEDGYMWNDRNGYVYRAGYKPPTKTDILFLYCLLFYSQSQNWKEKLTTSRYRIFKDCGIQPGKYWRDRLEESLKRWKMIAIEFKGTFYDGKTYQTLNFGIIDAWNIEDETKQLNIRFSSEWLLRIKESAYFKYINFDLIKTLRSPLIIRLYEILIKSFQNRKKWEIDTMKLAQKIPMNEKYPADVIPKIKAGVNRINDHTTLKVKLTTRRPKRGKAILVFEKLIEEESKQLPPTAGLPEDDSFKSLTSLLLTEHRNKKTILEAVASSYKKHGFDYVARNIKYTNHNCKGNYRAYLNKSLKEDWGLDIQEDENSKQTIINEQEQKIQQEREAMEQQKELQSRAREHIKTLSTDELESLREEAISRLDEEAKKNAEKFNKLEFVVNLGIEEIIEERLKAGECR